MWEWKKHGFAQEAQVRAWAWLPEPQGDTPKTGALSGLRFGVKDVIDVRGMPTLYGCEGMQASPKSWDATVVALLRAAGAVPIGKTVTAEFAFMRPGPTANPRALEHTPGGSSSGSAAAVAAGMVDFALGTQTGGSIIRPAAYCGVVGFKPSFGLVPRQGMLVTAETLDTIGWFSRDIALSSRLLATLTQQPEVAAQLPARVTFLRGWPALERGVEQLLERAVHALQNAGVEVQVLEGLPGIMERLAQVHHIVDRYEIARGMQGVQQAQAHLLSDVLQQAIREGLSMDIDTYRKAQHERAKVARDLGRLLGTTRYIIAPSAQDFAPRGLHSTGSSLPLRPWSLLGWPCMHLPFAQSAQGLPQGIQLVGMPGEDHVLHSHAAAVHAVLGSAEY